MTSAIAITLTLFVALLAGLEIGRWLRQALRIEGDDSRSAGPAEGVVFAVLGLLLAFTFTSAAARFDARRKLIVDQADALSTAWMRLDLLSESDRQPIRALMRQWIRRTLDHPPGKHETELLDAEQLATRDLEFQVWQRAVSAAGRLRDPQLATLVLPPINDWIDLSTQRAAMNYLGTPPLVMPTLCVLSLVGAVLAGWSMARRPRRSVLHMLLFSGVIAGSLGMIRDMNHARSGLIRVDAADIAMRQLYDSMMRSDTAHPPTDQARSAAASDASPSPP